ncbi:MAG: hypothetical protein V4674_03515 [Patescibacteria group bacterium]
MPKKNIIIIAIVALALLGGAAYLFGFGGGDSSSSVTQTGALGAGGAISKESSDFLSIVAGLRTISIDTSIFTNPAFTQLVDFGVPLTPQPVRNSNPFLPFGVAPSASESSLDR